MKYLSKYHTSNFIYELDSFDHWILHRIFVNLKNSFYNLKYLEICEYLLTTIIPTLFNVSSMLHDLGYRSIHRCSVLAQSLSLPHILILRKWMHKDYWASSTNNVLHSIEIIKREILQCVCFALIKMEKIHTVVQNECGTFANFIG